MVSHVDDLEDGLSSIEVFDTFNWLNQFKELGVKQLPIKPKTKHVLVKKYNLPDYSVNTAFWRQKKIGIGCITTAKFVDVDCDSLEAMFFAKRLLPATLTFGRQSKPSSHYLYLCTGMELQKRAFTKLPPEKLTKKEKTEWLQNSMMVEFRAANHMTVLPGSIHKSGELIEWTEKKATEKVPTTIDAISLFKKVQLIALAQVLIDHDIWTEGQRQLVAGYISGALWNANIDLEDARNFFKALSEYTEEESSDARDRIKYLEGTYKKGDEGEETGGLVKLADELGLDERLVAYIRKILQLKQVNVELGKLNLRYGKGNNVQNSIYNVVEILMEHDDLKGKVRYNTFKQNVEYTSMPFNFDEDWQEWKDIDDYNFCYWLQSRGMQTTKDIVFAGVNVAAYKNKFSPIEDYLNGLAWDGNHRLDYWLINYLDANCEPLGDGDLDVETEKRLKKEYLRRVGRMFLISAIARALVPGCQVDTMLVLEGKTGIGKSTVLKSIMPDRSWMSEHLDGNLDKKDSMQSLKGKWFIEMSELNGIRATDVDTIKSFLSRTSDNYRSSYGRRNEDFPRQCVFFGTTEETEYLKDYGGNRRFWPVALNPKKIGIKQLEQDKDQIWAEAYVAYIKGEKWYFDDEEDDFEQYLLLEQSTRIVTDVIEQEVLRIADETFIRRLRDVDSNIKQKTVNTVTTTNILMELPQSLGNGHSAKKIGGILNRHGWNRKKGRVRGAMCWYYEPRDIEKFRVVHGCTIKESKEYRSPKDIEQSLKENGTDDEEY